MSTSLIILCLTLAVLAPHISQGHLTDSLPNTGLQTDEIEIHRSYRPELWARPTGRRFQRSPSKTYTVFVDAGSSGSRVWVYTWTDDSDEATGLPDVRAVGYMKVEPGLSTYADDEPGIKKVLTELINYAKKNVSEELQAETPIYLLATAGLRMLQEGKANRVIDLVYETLSDKSFCPFVVYDKDSVRILSGEEEGVFMWLAVNYLSKTLAKEGEPDATIGILELGGASTQIAFIPSGILLANKFPLDIADNRYALYVHSYLDFGQEQVLASIRRSLLAEQPGREQVDNPCMLKGSSETIESQRYVGTGKPEDCIKMLEEIVYKVEEHKCQPKPCAIGQAYQPSIPVNKTFYALGAFAPVLRNVKAVTDDQPVNFATVKQKAIEFCSKDVSELKTLYPNVLEKFVTKSCVTSLYLNVLLIRGYGFSETTNKIWVKDQANGKDLDWTLGALLYERLTHPVFKISALRDPSAVRSAASQNSSAYNGFIVIGFILFILNLL